jgi:uncharacterized protein (TIGR03083 family)
MKKLIPIEVIDLFPEVLNRLLELLSGLTLESWQRPTACSGWTVKDVAIHLLGDDLGMLSKGRDGYVLSNRQVENWAELVDLINKSNDQWVRCGQRISPRLIRELLQFTGDQVNEYFRLLDPYDTGNVVSWAGPEPAPVWLDLAREYTERWHHQQHIRDAVGVPGLKEPRYLSPVLDTFVRALPYTFKDFYADENALVVLKIMGSAGGTWFLRREKGEWGLYLKVEGKVVCEVTMDEEDAWRLFTKGLTVEEARSRIGISGNEAAGERVLETVAIIA